MIKQIKKHITEVKSFTANSLEDVEIFRIKYLGRKGLMKDFFVEFKNLPKNQKKEFGQNINTLKIEYLLIKDQRLLTIEVDLVTGKLIPLLAKTTRELLLLL